MAGLNVNTQIVVADNGLSQQGTVLYDTSTPILTSTDETVDVTITQTSGYVILYSNNWIGSYNLDFTDSNCKTGALADLH